MSQKLALVVVAGLLVAADDATKAPQSSHDKVQGTWTIVTLEMPGKKEDPPRGARLSFEGDKFIIRMGPRAIRATFKIDDSKSPAHIDILVSKDDDSPYKGKTAHGIVEVEGDTLKWCSFEPGDAGRPKEFGAKAARTATFMICKRERR